MSTLPDALVAAAGRGRGELLFHLDDQPIRLGAEELAERAQAAAGLLANRGVGTGDRVGLLGSNRPEWVVWAYATWFAGAALVPLQFPLRVRDRAAFVERLCSIVRAADCRTVVTDPALAFAVDDDLAVAWDERATRPAPPLTSPPTDSPAVIQFTSGSTAAPKGAVLTHDAVVAQIRSLDGRVVHPGEVILGWAPFFHDLGLFLYAVAGILLDATTHVLPTERFARAPAEWLNLVARTRATLTVGPQSAWAAALGAARRRGEKLELGSLEAALFAAEAIDPAFVDRIHERAQLIGLSPGAIGATYGLAEAVLGVSTSIRGDGIRFHQAAVASSSGSTRRVVSSGVPMSDMAVRIADDGARVPDGGVGEIQVMARSLMSGYLGDDAGSPFVDGWLRTGDLGYIHGEELHVTGRIKDLLIVLGHNYYPEDFEWAAGRVAGVRAGRSVAFVDGSAERIVLMVEPRDGQAGSSLAPTVRHAVADAVGTAPDEVVVVPPGTIEKTTSGKLRRAAMRAVYERGRRTD